MKNNILVSVIIPNYNHEKFLVQRIESVTQQSYQNIEILILDDASTDNSLSVIKEQAEKDNRIRIIANENNSGSTFKQWHKGIQLAQGEYVWIAESDDYAHPELLACTIKGFKGNTVLAFCESIKVDEKNRKIGDVHPQKSIWHTDFEQSGIELFENFFAYNNFVINASCAVFNRKAALNVPEEFISFKFCGDWFFWVAIMLQGNVSHFHHQYNYYRIHTQNVTSKALSNSLYLLEGLTIPNVFSKKGVRLNREKLYGKWLRYLRNDYRKHAETGHLPIKVILFLLRNNPKLLWLYYFSSKTS